MQAEVELYRVKVKGQQGDVYYLNTPFGIYVNGLCGVVWSNLYLFGGWAEARDYIESNFGKLIISNRLEFLLDKGVSFEQSLRRIS
jgi:hypothetical protein